MTEAFGSWKHNRQPILDALTNSRDIQAVLRLSLAEDSDGSPQIVAATVAIVESIPVFVLSHALNDARRRVHDVVGPDVDVFIEPDLVTDPDREHPPTDVIVIRASD